MAAGLPVVPPSAATPSRPASGGPSAGADGTGASFAPAGATIAAPEGEIAQAVAWLRWGRARGLSSEALLFAALAGTAPRDDDWHGRTSPSCRAELYRCLRLTAELPWTRRGLEPLGAAFPAWRALARAWDELAATMAAEIGPTWPLVDLAPGRWPDTTRTQALLRATLSRAGGR